LGAKGGGGRGAGDGGQGETEAGSSLRAGQSGFPRPHGAGEGQASGAAQIWGRARGGWGGRGVGRHEIRGDAEKANVCGKRGF